MLCAIFLWDYIFSQVWVGMLCATLPYALCNYLCPVSGYIFSSLSGNPPYLMLCATVTYALCYFLWGYILKALGNARCNLTLCFVLLVGIWKLCILNIASFMMVIAVWSFACRLGPEASRRSKGKATPQVKWLQLSAKLVLVRATSAVAEVVQ